MPAASPLATRMPSGCATPSDPEARRKGLQLAAQTGQLHGRGRGLLGSGGRLVSHIAHAEHAAVDVLGHRTLLLRRGSDLQVHRLDGGDGAGDGLQLLADIPRQADRLVGQVLGNVGKLPAIYTELEINYFLLRRLLGVKSDDKKQTKVEKLTRNEVLMVNIGSTSTGGRVMSVKADLAKIFLTSPACTEVGEKIALSRRIDKHWRLVGWGSVRRGTQLEV